MKDFITLRSRSFNYQSYAMEASWYATLFSLLITLPFKTARQIQTSQPVQPQQTPQQAYSQSSTEVSILPEVARIHMSVVSLD